MSYTWAQWYDRLAFDIDYERYAEIVESILAISEVDARRFLDIGAGTGTLAALFGKGERKIDLLDASSDMLTMARQKLGDDPRFQYFHTKIQDFTWGERYDVIVAPLNVFNYLRPEECRKVFLSAFEALSDKGYLFFDLNTPYKLHHILGDNTFVYEIDEIFYTWENYAHKDHVHQILDFFIEEQDGRYRRIHDEMVEYVYTTEITEDILKRVGFKNIKKIDPDTGKAPTAESEKVLYIAIKE